MNFVFLGTFKCYFVIGIVPQLAHITISSAPCSLCSGFCSMHITRESTLFPKCVLNLWQSTQKGFTFYFQEKTPPLKQYLMTASTSLLSCFGLLPFYGLIYHPRAFILKWVILFKGYSRASILKHSYISLNAALSRNIQLIFQSVWDKILAFL